MCASKTQVYKPRHLSQPAPSQGCALQACPSFIPSPRRLFPSQPFPWVLWGRCRQADEAPVSLAEPREPKQEAGSVGAAPAHPFTPHSCPSASGKAAAPHAPSQLTRNGLAAAAQAQRAPLPTPGPDLAVYGSTAAIPRNGIPEPPVSAPQHQGIRGR